jgi:hypothetical protein
LISVGVGASEQAVIATTAATAVAANKSFLRIKTPLSFYALRRNGPSKAGEASIDTAEEVP